MSDNTGEQQPAEETGRQAERRSPPPAGAGIAIGIALGAGVGVALQSLAIGIAIGIAFAVAFEMAFKRQREAGDA